MPRLCGHPGLALQGYIMAIYRKKGAEVKTDSCSEFGDLILIIYKHSQTILG